MTKEQLKIDLQTFRPWTVISAWKSDISDEVNHVRHALLWTDLVTLDNVYYAKSIYDQDGLNGEKEESYLVFGMPRYLTEQIAKKYDQESILHSEYVIEVEFFDTPPEHLVSYSSTFINPDEQVHWVADIHEPPSFTTDYKGDLIHG